MQIDWLNVTESLFRWVHIAAGVIWIGHLYFFNFVNANFAPTMDGDTKKKVVPELMPRALYFFRWGAAWTWITGIVLLALIYYHGKIAFQGGRENAGWTAIAILMIVIVLFAFVIYDVLFKILKKGEQQFVVGLVLATAVVYGLLYGAGFGFRGTAIHLGTMFGTIMAANVWMRIWPSQRRIITAIKNGEKPDADVVALAGLRSKHNTYMSVPLLFTMMNQHAFWASSFDFALPVFVLVGWLCVYWLYKKAATVKGL